LRDFQFSERFSLFVSGDNVVPTTIMNSESAMLRRFLKSARCFAVFTVLGLAPFATQAQTPSLAEMTVMMSNILQQKFGTDGQIDQAVFKTYGTELTGGKLETARENLRSILANRELPSYLAKIVLAVPSSELTKERVQIIAAESMMAIQTKGLLRLSADKQAAFVTHMYDMTGWLPAQLCRDMFLGRLSSEQSVMLERRYIVSLPLSKFQHISNLYREAVSAELSGYPDARTINATQAKIAEEMRDEIAKNRIRKNMPLEAIQRVASGIETAPAQDVCSVMRESVAALLDMKEPFRSWQLTRFAEALQ
jgi:hypothetical protein